MKKSTARAIGIGLLVIAAAFVGYALGHPEASFPWSSGITYGIYAVYAAAVVVFLIAPFDHKQR